MPEGSYVLVADTVADQIIGNSRERNWGPGDSPASALKEFLSTKVSWEIDYSLSRRAIISESALGWIKKSGN